MTYEVFDEYGDPVGRVILPLDPGVVGIGKGTVYLDRGRLPRSASSQGPQH
jgi:hypothetical protein